MTCFMESFVLTGYFGIFGSTLSNWRISVDVNDICSYVSFVIPSFLEKRQLSPR